MGEAQNQKDRPLRNRQSCQSEGSANSGDSVWLAAGDIIWILALLWRVDVSRICRAPASLGCRAAAHVRNGALFVAGIDHGQRTPDRSLGWWRCVEFLFQSQACE